MNHITDTYKLDTYLSSSNLSTEEKQTLFKFRTRMVQVKSNFKNQYGQNLTCHFCPAEETQSHILLCKETSDIDTSQVSYDDIFGDISKQEKIAKVLNKILKLRNSKLEILTNT